MLTEAVGRGKREEKIVQEALDNTIYSICAYDDEKLIDYGIMNCLLNKIKEYKEINPNIRTYLGASKGKEGFYEKFGFVSRPNDELGAGMILKK